MQCRWDRASLQKSRGIAAAGWAHCAGSRWHNETYCNNNHKVRASACMRLHYTTLSAALQSAPTMCLSAALVHLENTADDFRVRGEGKGEGAVGGRVCRKVQSYASQMNLIVESSHVHTVTCINGLMEGSVGTQWGDQCQELECRSHRSCQS